MADFDWNWPKKIERDVVERALTLDFVEEHRTVVLLGPNGVGKTMSAKSNTSSISKSIGVPGEISFGAVSAATRSRGTTSERPEPRSERATKLPS